MSNPRFEHEDEVLTDTRPDEKIKRPRLYRVLLLLEF